MKLMTKEIEKRLVMFPLYSQDGKGKDATVVAKYFLGSFTWLVLEAQKLSDGDFEFFGITYGLDGPEYGYFCLSDLKNIKGPMGLGVERDLFFTPQPLEEVRKNFA